MKYFKLRLCDSKFNDLMVLLKGNGKHIKSKAKAKKEWCKFLSGLAWNLFFKKGKLKGSLEEQDEKLFLSGCMTLILMLSEFFLSALCVGICTQKKITSCCYTRRLPLFPFLLPSSLPTESIKFSQFKKLMKKEIIELIKLRTKIYLRII